MSNNGEAANNNPAPQEHVMNAELKDTVTSAEPETTMNSAAPLERRMSAATQSYHAFLESLKGKVVTIYRGGPESKTGTLLDVKSDYVTLYANNNNNNKNKNNNNNNNNNNNDGNNNNNNTVIYYQAQHVKSISEDSKSNSMQVMQAQNQEEVEFLEADTFAELVAQLSNETIQINQGGPESKRGVLLGVRNDFLHLFTEDDGVIYYNIHHIKSVSKYQDDNNNNNNHNNNQQEEIQYPEIIDASDFNGVFKHLEHKWVSINRGGPEAMEGVLVENAGGHYTLVSNEEVLRIHPYHIRSISVGPKGSFQNNNQNNQNNDQNNQNNNQDNEQNDNQNNNQAENKSNNDKNNKDDSRSSSKSSRRRSRYTERVTKTIDYDWKF